MQRGIDYKQCPKCGLAAALADPQCLRCGHLYSTQFGPTNQTQAFIPGSQPPPNQTQAFTPGGYPPPNQTQAFMPGAQPYGYPPYQQQDQFATFLLSIPPFVCFIIGFFTNVIAIGLLICYFAYPPARDSRRGWATAWGMITAFALGALAFIISMALPFLLPTLVHKH